MGRGRHYARAAGTSSHPTDGLGIHVEIFISPLTIPTFYKQLTILKIIWETGSVGPTVHKSRLYSSLLEKSRELSFLVVTGYLYFFLGSPG